MKFLKSLAVLATSALLAANPVAAVDDKSAVSYLSELGYSGYTGATATSLAGALQSAYTSIHTRTDFISAWSVIATAVPTKVWESLALSGYSYIETTAPPSWFTGLPDDVKKEVLLEQSQVGAVVTSVLKITRTSTGGAAQQTAGVVVGGAAVAGLLGAVALL